MKTPSLKKCLWGIFYLLLVILAGGTAHSGQGGVTRIYKNAIAPFDDAKNVKSVLALPDDTVLVRTFPD